MNENSAKASVKTIELLFDFVSPNGYLIWQPLKDIAVRYGAAIEITPVFLAGMHKLTGNAPPFIRDGEVKGKNEYAMMEMNRFIARHDIARFKLNPNFPFNSIGLQRMLAGIETAQRDALVELLLIAIWEDELDVSNADAVSAVLNEAGFDAEKLSVLMRDAAIKQRVSDNTDHAVERGAFGIPTMFVTNDGTTEMFFGKERLGQIEDMLAT